MRKMLNTDFRKLVALILVCFLLTNLWVTFVSFRTYDSLETWHSLQFHSMELHLERLRGQFCISTTPYEYLNAPHCKELKRSAPNK